MSSSSTVRKGNQEPRIKLEPPREYTDGQDAALFATDFGLNPDPWQQTILDAWLGRDEYDQFAATTCCVAVPRQNGKNAIIEMRELYGLCVLGEKILHTAHEVKTAAVAFRRLQSFFQDDDHPEIEAMVKTIRQANGQESIKLKNGGEISVSARSRGASRGLTTDLVVFDEAQELTDEQMEAILSTMAAAPSGNRQLILTGTPPSPTTPGTVFPSTRQLVINNTAKRTTWHEWSVEDIGDVTDRDRWYETNPAMGYRLTEEFTETELQMLSKDGFARERLGWWSPRTTAVPGAINESDWAACATDKPPHEGKKAYAVKFSPDGKYAALAVCLRPDVEVPHVEVIEFKPVARSVKWLADWLALRSDEAAQIVIDGRARVDALERRLLDAGVSKRVIKKTSSTEIIAACSMFADAVEGEAITHWDSEKQALLDESATKCPRRAIGRSGGWAFDDAPDGTPSIVAESVALAYWAVSTTKRDPRRKMRIG